MAGTAHRSLGPDIDVNLDFSFEKNNVKFTFIKKNAYCVNKNRFGLYYGIFSKTNKRKTCNLAKNINFSLTAVKHAGYKEITENNFHI